MKRYLLSIILCVLAAFALSAQEQDSPKVPMTVSISEASSNVPASSWDFLTTRLNAAITKNGMGATDDFTQFFLSCTYSVVDKHIVPGSPTKYFQTVEMNYFVVDAFAQKIFSSVAIETKGVGNSEEQAVTASIRKISPSNAALSSFIKESNRKIIKYYNEQYRNIIAMAQALAKVYKYEEALFRLSTVPEACSGFQEVLDVAVGIYQKYLDDKANKALARAMAIWNAGQDSYAAAEAGEYLAEILPDATCYPQAVALSNEIKARVKSDIDYYRKREEVREDRAYKLDTEKVKAWRSVGVAYGNNQKSVYYHRTLY